MFDIKRDLRGIIASLHTPFDADDHIDLASLARLVAHCGESGCSGVLVTAVAGEVGALSNGERAQILETVTSAANGKLKIVAGISADRVSDSIAQATLAQEHEIPVVMWQPPAGLSEAELIDALQAIADVGEHQIMMQDLDWTGPGIAPELIARAADAVPAFTAIKIETAPAGPKYAAVAETCQGRLHLSGGWAVMQMLDGLARGLDAFIPSGLLAVQVRIFDAWQNGNHDEARRLFEKILPIMAFSNQHIDVSGRFWKHVRVQQGIFKTDRCRLPAPLDPVQTAEAEYLCRRVLSIETAEAAKAAR